MPAALLLASYVGWFVFLGGILLLPGLLLSRLVRPMSSIKVPTVILGVAFGAAFWIFAVFCLSATRLLSARTVGGIVVVLVLVTLPPLRAAWRRWRVEQMSAAFGTRIAPADGVLFLSIVSVLAVLFLQALSPEVATDAQVYHLHVPKVTIDHGGFTHIPFNVYSHWPMNIQMLFTLALLLKDQVLASLVHYFFGVLVVAGLILFGRQRHTTRAGFFAAALFLANGAVLFEMPIAYVDVASAFLPVRVLLVRRSGPRVGRRPSRSPRRRGCALRRARRHQAQCRDRVCVARLRLCRRAVTTGWREEGVA